MSFSASYLTPGYRPDKHGWWKADTGAGNFGYPMGYYFADTMRACSIAFGAFFKDVYVVRYDEQGYPRKCIQVPIKFGPRAKSHDQRTRQESEENGQSYYLQNPSLTWKYTAIAYDSNRATSRDSIRSFYDTYLMENGVQYSTCELLWKDTMPIPYNISIELKAYCDKIADANQIVEQVCAKFNPESFVFIKEFWFMNIRRDIKMKLESVGMEIQSDAMESEAKREIEVTFQFQLEAFFYKPIENGDIITSIVTTLDAHTNGYDVARFGISGNAYKDAKYEDYDVYAEAASGGYFDGSYTSGYDFTKNGTVTIGPEYRMVGFSATPIYDVGNGVSGYDVDYWYENIPDTYVEYSKNDVRLIKQQFRSYGTAEEKHGWNAFSAEYEPMALTTGTNNYKYGERDLLDNQNDVVRTIYATSHEHVKNTNK